LLIDLHTHSTASDGTRTPSEVVDFAHACGCLTLALTDHDTIDGLKSASERASELGVEFVPGIELNTNLPNGSELHILGYYVNPDADPLQTLLSSRRASLPRRLEQILAKLYHLGFPLTMDEVLALAKGAVVNRAHVAQAMVLRGYVPDGRTAIQRFLQTGGPAFVARADLSPWEAVRLIRAIGGLPVLAHPGLYRGEEVLDPCIEAGLAGIEVYYRQHTPEQIAYYKGLADQHRLLSTKGTDCHGPGTHYDCRIGDVEIPLEIMEPFRRAGTRSYPSGFNQSEEDAQ